MKKIIEYLIESREELKKVSWPKRNEVLRLTAVVLIISAATALYLSLLDSLLTRLGSFIIKNR